MTTVESLKPLPQFSLFMWGERSRRRIEKERQRAKERGDREAEPIIFSN